MAKKVKMVLYAEPGVGKSTYAGKAPNPFFICTDGNYSWLGLPDEDHVEVSSWDEAKKVFADINANKEKYAKYDTIVVDLIEDLFKWCEYEYCKKNKISHMSDLGFGKAYDETRNEFYIEICKVLNVDKHVILLTHGIVKVEKNRQGIELTKYAPSNRIPDKVWDMIEGRVRYFLRAYTKGEENEAGRMIKKRYLSIIPKENEFGIARGLDESTTPEDIELEFDVFATTIGLDEVPTQPVKKTKSTKVVKPVDVDNEPDIETRSVPVEIEPEIEVPTPVKESIVEPVAKTETSNVDPMSESFVVDCLKQGLTVVEAANKYGFELTNTIKSNYVKIKYKHRNEF